MSLSYDYRHGVNFRALGSYYDKAYSFYSMFESYCSVLILIERQIELLETNMKILNKCDKMIALISQCAAIQYVVVVVIVDLRVAQRGAVPWLPTAPVSC